MYRNPDNIGALFYNRTNEYSTAANATSPLPAAHHPLQVFPTHRTALCLSSAEGNEILARLAEPLANRRGRRASAEVARCVLSKHTQRGRPTSKRETPIATWLASALYARTRCPPHARGRHRNWRHLVPLGAILGQDSSSIDQRDRMARYPRHSLLYHRRSNQGYDLAPLEHSARTLRSAINVCRTKGARDESVRQGGTASCAVGLHAHDVAVLRRVLWAAVYGEQHVPARRDRRHRRDMRSRSFDQAEQARFRATAHRHAPSRLDRAEHASAILHAPHRTQRCPVERSFCLVRRAFDCGLARHVGGSCRVLERVDRGKLYVLPKVVRRWFFAGRKTEGCEILAHFTSIGALAKRHQTSLSWHQEYH